jgi:hypothetical protein
MESHVPGKLDTKMPKATNALHSDQISRRKPALRRAL